MGKQKSDTIKTTPLHSGVMFDKLTPEQIEILKHRIRTFGGFWETLCECGADTFNVHCMTHVPSPSGKFKDRKSPTGLVHTPYKDTGSCDKDIIVHKWHYNFPDNMPKYVPDPICSECGQSLPSKT